MSVGKFGALAVAVGIGLGASACEEKQANAAEAAASTATALSIRLEGVRSDEGRLYVAVFDEEQAFNNADDQRAAAVAIVRAQKGSIEISINPMPEGAYAVSVFHDENNNGNLEMNAGIPLEGYGMSGANDRFSTPSFAEALVRDGSASVQLYYLN